MRSLTVGRGRTYVRTYVRMCAHVRPSDCASAKSGYISASSHVRTYVRPRPTVRLRIREIRIHICVVSVTMFPQARQEGDINSLIIEGRTIQHSLKQNNNRYIKSDTEQQTACRFAKLMMNRKIRTALRLLSDEEKGAPLPLDTQLATNDHQPPTTVHDELLK